MLDLSPEEERLNIVQLDDGLYYLSPNADDCYSAESLRLAAGVLDMMNKDAEGSGVELN